MKNFKVNGKLGEYELSLPESLSEIPVEYLKECTDFVHPANDYALIGVVYKDSLNLVLTAAKKKQAANVAVIPVFIKTGKTDCEFVNNLNLGDKVVVSASDLSIGHHINSPMNKITPQHIIDVCENAGQAFYQNTLAMHTPVCFLEFKLVPVSAIHAHLDKSVSMTVNPFVHKVMSEAGEA